MLRRHIFTVAQNGQTKHRPLDRNFRVSTLHRLTDCGLPIQTWTGSVRWRGFNWLQSATTPLDATQSFKRNHTGLFRKVPGTGLMKTPSCKFLKSRQVDYKTNSMDLWFSASAMFDMNIQYIHCMCVCVCLWAQHLSQPDSGWRARIDLLVE